MSPLQDKMQASSSGTDGKLVMSIDDLSVEFATEHGWATVVDHVSFDVNQNEIVGLVGESGSGKTISSLSILGLLPSAARITTGQIMFEGRDLTSLPRRELRKIRGNDVSMVFQEPMTSLNPAFTVGDQIAENVLQHRKVTRKAALGRAVEVLDLVGIPNARRRLGAYPHEFSGGMRQRVMIALALACDPRMLIADEPTTALDVTVQSQILELIMRLREEIGMSVLFVTHDLGVVAEICDRVVVMYAGRVAEVDVAESLFAHPGHPYTSGLLSAMPQLGSQEDRLSSIAGHTPEPWNMPVGCRFSPRCMYAEDACDEPGADTLVAVDTNGWTACRRHKELILKGSA